MELIKHEATQLDDDGPSDLGSLVPHESYPDRQSAHESYQDKQSGHERWGSSSPEPLEIPGRPSYTRDGIRIPGIRRLSAHELEYSGDELAHYSDFSDSPSQSNAQSSSFRSFVNRNQRAVQKSSDAPYAEPTQPSSAMRNVSQSSGIHVDQHDEERVIWHGYLLCLKTKGGVRQWKRLWVVLRPKNLAFYKNDEVKSPLHPFLPSVPPLSGPSPRTILINISGIRRQPNPPPLQHHQCRRDRSHVPQQRPLYANHCRRKKLSFLCQ